MAPRKLPAFKNAAREPTEGSRAVSNILSAVSSGATQAWAPSRRAQGKAARRICFCVSKAAWVRRQSAPFIRRLLPHSGRSQTHITAPPTGSPSRFPPRLPLQLPSPEEKTQQLPSRVPHKAEHIASPESLGWLTGICLHPPAKKLAAPWRQAMTACRIPQKLQRRKQFRNPLNEDSSGSWNKESQPITAACQTDCPTQAAKSPTRAQSLASSRAKAG